MWTYWYSLRPLHEISIKRKRVVNVCCQDLSGELESELSGNFRSCAKALCLPPDVYDASEIKRAIKV